MGASEEVVAVNHDTLLDAVDAVLDAAESHDTLTEGVPHLLASIAALRLVRATVPGPRSVWHEAVENAERESVVVHATVSEPRDDLGRPIEEEALTFPPDDWRTP